MTDYNLSNSYVGVSNSNWTAPIESFCAKTAGAHNVWAVLIIAVLVLAVIVLAYKIHYGAEGYGDGPTSMTRHITGDQYGLANNKYLSAKYGEADTEMKNLPTDPTSCKDRKPVTTDAWTWMDKVAEEGFQGDAESTVPTTESGFSKILAGH